MADVTTRRRTAGLSVGSAGPALFTLGGLAAAFGVASCCALPMLLTMLGLGTAWLGGIALLAAPHRPILIAAAALGLLGGAATLWRQRTATACQAGSSCARPAGRVATSVGLLLGLALLMLGYTYA